MASEGDKIKSLRTFLESSLDENELERFLVENDYREIASSVAKGLGRTQYCFNVVFALYEKNLINDDFFDHLAAELRFKAEDIRGLQWLWRAQIIDDAQKEIPLDDDWPDRGGTVINANRPVLAEQLTPPKLEVLSIPGDGDDALSAPEYVRVFLDRNAGASRPTTLLAVTRKWAGREALSFRKVMSEVKTLLVQGVEPVKHVVVFCRNWNSFSFDAEHRKELEAHANKGVRFWFVRVSKQAQVSESAQSEPGHA
jgi:hypothetical protein